MNFISLHNLNNEFADPRTKRLRFTCATYAKTKCSASISFSFVADVDGKSRYKFNNDATTFAHSNHVVVVPETSAILRFPQIHRLLDDEERSEMEAIYLSPRGGGPGKHAFHYICQIYVLLDSV